MPAPLTWPSDPAAAQLGMADPAAVPTCSSAAPLLTSDSLGPLRPGQSLLEVQVLCSSVQPVWDWGDEAVPSPALLTRLGPASVSALVEDTLPSSRVIEWTVRDEHVRTGEGIGVGSTLQEVRSAYGSPTLYEGECVIEAVFEKQPGLIWRLDMPEGALDCQDIPQVVEQNAVDRIPAESRVQSVRVVGASGA